MKDDATRGHRVQRNWTAVDGEAALVPILALLIQTAYAATREGRVSLLNLFFHSFTLPMMLLAVIVSGLISHALLRPFNHDRSIRAFVFLLTVGAFAGVACYFTGDPIVK
jgi:hypothetical protein